MGHQTGRSIATEELADRVLDALDDIFQDGLLSENIYEKKSDYGQVLRAINHADRITARDMNLSGQVVLYVPADTNQIIFSEQYQYVAEYMEDIHSQEADLIDRDFIYFLGRTKFLDVIAINDRYLYVYDEYPTGGNESTSRIKKLSDEDYKSLEDRERRLSETYFSRPYYEDSSDDLAWCYFIPDEGRIVINKQFKTESFLLFNGRLMPGVLTLGDLSKADITGEDWDAYRVISPHWALELLVAESLRYLIPLSSGKARRFIEQEVLIQKEGFESKKPGDSNVIVPHFSY